MKKNLFSQSVVLLIIVFCTSNELSSADITIQEINREALIQLQQKNNDYSKILQPALAESIANYFSGKHPSAIPLDSFLLPDINVENNKVANPYLAYAVWNLVNSNEFKTAPQEQKKKIYNLLLDMLFSKQKSDDYALQFKPIYSALITKFDDYTYYDNHAKAKVLQFIQNHDDDINSRRLSKALLLLLIMDYESKEVLSANKDLWLKFSNQYSKDNIRAESPLISLIILAYIGEDFATQKINDIVKEIRSSHNKIQRANYIFPFLSLVRNSKMVVTLKDCLEDNDMIDQGSDILNRYKGISSLAACSLYAMLEGFPTFSAMNFDQTTRKICLIWCQKQKIYNFKKINYNQKDEIISRLRYMIFIR